MCEKFLEYNTNCQPYQIDTIIPQDRFCNGMTFINRGNTIAVIQGDPLNPGESKSIGGNRGEIYKGRIDLNFQLPAIVPPVPANLLIVTQKFYVNLDK